MQVNSVSFKGLWSGPEAQRLVGRDPHCKNGQIYKQTYFYYPFKDETDSDVLMQAHKINSSVFALDDKSDEDPYGPEAYYIPEVKIGERLNITADEYEQISKLSPAIFQDTTDLKYTVMKDHKVAQLIRREV